MPDPGPDADLPHDRILILSYRTADNPAGVGAAAEALCDDCHETVWWSQSTVDIVRESGLPVHVRCNRCAQRLGSGGRPPPPTQAQRLEIAQATGLYGDALDRVIEGIMRQLFGGPGVPP